MRIRSWTIRLRQRARFEKQARQKEQGDDHDEAQGIDEDFIDACFLPITDTDRLQSTFRMEYGPDRGVGHRDRPSCDIPHGFHKQQRSVSVPSDETQIGGKCRC